MPPPLPYDVVAVWGTGPADVYAIATSSIWHGSDEEHVGHLVHYDGEAWAEVPGLEIGVLHLKGAGPGALFLAGRDGTVMVYDGTEERITWQAPALGAVSVWGDEQGPAWLAFGYDLARPFSEGWD